MSPARNIPPAASDDLKGDVRVLTVQVGELTKKVDEIRSDLKNTFASKEELREVRQDVVEIKGHIGWIVKLALGLIVTAIIGLVIVKGGAVR